MSVLVPWHKLRANQLVTREVANLSDRIAATREESSKGAYSGGPERSRTQDEVAEVWFDILVRGSADTNTELAHLEKWLASLKRPLFTPTSTHLARVAARVAALKAHAHGFARNAFDLMDKAREDAEAKSETSIGISRALIALDIAESEAYFHEAIRVTSRMGDEVLDRWVAILDLADGAADNVNLPEYAYRLARSAELVETFNRKHFEWTGTARAICRLSPPSGFSILSRWRDRDFASFDSLLPTIIDELINVNRLAPEVAATLVGFRARWEYPRRTAFKPAATSWESLVSQGCDPDLLNMGFCMACELAGSPGDVLVSEVRKAAKEHLRDAKTLRKHLQATRVCSIRWERLSAPRKRYWGIPPRRPRPKFICTRFRQTHATRSRR